VFRAFFDEAMASGPENYRSQRAVERIGAVRAGTRIDGYGRERLAFEITTAMFEETRKELAR
jgi:RimJ/RimL family protein N-acetyltransferase